MFINQIFLNRYSLLRGVYQYHTPFLLRILHDLLVFISILSLEHSAHLIFLIPVPLSHYFYLMGHFFFKLFSRSLIGESQ